MILTGDCRDILPTLPDASIDCCVTSPPYALGLRNYGNIPNQIGQEATLDEYIEQLRDVFREVRRVLKPSYAPLLNPPFTPPPPPAIDSIIMVYR